MYQVRTLKLTAVIRCNKRTCLLKVNTHAMYPRSYHIPSRMIDKSKLGPLVTIVWPLSISVPHLKQISSLATEIWLKIQIKPGGVTILNFAKSEFFGTHRLQMVSFYIIYLRTKCNANIFFGDIDIAILRLRKFGWKRLFG